MGGRCCCAVALNGEGCGGCEDGADQEGDDDGGVEMNVGALERETQNHEESRAGNLQGGEQAGIDAGRDAGKGEKMGGEGNSAAERNDVSESDMRGEIA